MLKKFRIITEKKVDIAQLSIPLLIRLMEFAREDAKDDMILHRVAERIQSSNRVLDMDDYNSLVK